MIRIVIGVLGKVTKRIGTGTREFGNKRTKGDCQNYSIVEIDQNTKKSPGNLRKLAVTQTLVQNHQLTLVWYCPVGWSCRIRRLLLCRGVRPPLTSVLDMTLNNLMVRFQQCWSFGECGVPLHCHRSQVHSVPEW